MNRPDEAQVELPRRGHAEARLDLRKVAGEVDEGNGCLAHAPPGQSWTVLALTAFVDHGTRHGGELRWCEAVPHALGDGLGDEEIRVRVDAREEITLSGDAWGRGLTFQVAGLEQEVADAIELS